MFVRAWYILLVVLMVACGAGVLLCAAEYLGTLVFKWPETEKGVIPFPVRLLFPLVGIWIVLVIMLMMYSGIVIRSLYFNPWSLIFRNCPRLFYGVVCIGIFASINF